MFRPFFSVILAPDFPVLLPQLAVVFEARSNPTERGTTISGCVRLIDDDAKEKIRVDVGLTWKDEAMQLSPTQAVAINLNGLVFEQPGTYNFEVQFGESFFEWKLEVMQIPPPGRLLEAQ